MVDRNQKVRSRRGGGRNARRASRREKLAQASKPYIERKIPYFEYLNEESLDLIEKNADILLQEIGIDFLDDQEALDMWRDAGADIDGMRVRFPIGLCLSLIHI